jgi:hypothetical protein
MKRMTLSALTAATFLACALPAGAQMAPAGSQPMGAETNGSSSATGNGTAMAMTCQGMMDKAMPMSDGMSDGSKKTMAMKHMDMAKADQSNGDEAGCKTQMHMAMKAMM